MKTSVASLRHPAAVAALAAAFALSGSLSAQTWTGLGTGDSWGTAANWSSAPTFNTSADFTFNAPTARPNMAVGANRTARSLTFTSGVSADMSISFNNLTTGAVVLTLQAASGNASINVNSGSTGNITLGLGSVGTGTGSVTLGSSVDVTHNGGGLLLFNRPVNGTGGITKTGTGTMQLQAPAFTSNAFSGALAVNGGRLIAASADGTADFNSSSGVTLGGGTLEIRTSAADKTINPSISVTTASSLVFNNTSGTTSRNMTIGNTTAMAVNAALTIQNISANSSLNNLMNVTRAITGTGNISVETTNNIASTSDNFSLGRLGLSGDNSGWSGNLLVSKGTVLLSGNAINGSAAGTGRIEIGSTGDAFGAGLTFFSGAAANSTLTFANSITVNSGGFRAIKGGNTDHNIVLSGPVTLNGNLTVDHLQGANDRSITLAGNITGTGALNVVLSNTTFNTSLVLTGSNSYSGGTTIASGAKLSIGNGGSTGSLAGNVVNGGTLIANRSNDFAISGNISGAGSLTKLGAGNLTLSGGANSYAGGTTVTSGGLIVDGALGSSANAVTVSSGAALGGDGSIAGDIAFASGANFIFNTSATLGVTGAVSFGGFGVTNLLGLNSTTIAGSYLLLDGTGSNVSQTNVANIGLINALSLGDGKLAYFDFTNGDLAVVVASAIPEPGSFALFGGLCGLGTVLLRRRRRSL